MSRKQSQAAEQSQVSPIGGETVRLWRALLRLKIRLRVRLIQKTKYFQAVLARLMRLVVRLAVRLSQIAMRLA